MFACFICFFLSFHNIFVVKYWTLSLKIKSLIETEEQISAKTTFKINLVFWSNQFLILLITSLCIGASYRCFDLQFHYRLVQDIFSGVAISVSLIDNFLICNAFIRFKQTLDHDKIGISNKQVYSYLGSFCTATVALIFLFSATTVALYGLGDGNKNLHLQYVLLATELCIVLLSISVIPIFNMFNRLLNQMIQQ